MHAIQTLVSLMALAMSTTAVLAMEEVRRVPRFSDLPIEIQMPIARFLVDGKILEIEEAKAHGITEVKIAYERPHRLHELIWDATHKKLLGGTEATVVTEVLGRLPSPLQQTIQSHQGQNRIDKLKSGRR